MRKIVQCARGATSIEYGLFAGLAAIVLMSGASTIGGKVNGTFAQAGAAMAAATGGPPAPAATATPRGVRIEIKEAEGGFLKEHEDQ